MDLLKRTVLHVWAMSWCGGPPHVAQREAWFAQTGGVRPGPWQLLIKRPEWRVRVSVWARWGRGLGRRRWFRTATNSKERRARVHA